MWHLVVILCLAPHSCAAPIAVFSDHRVFAQRFDHTIPGSPYEASCENIAQAYNRMKHIPQQAVCVNN